MRVKRLPTTDPSPSRSGPPRSGSTRRPILAGVPFLLTLLMLASPVEGQRASVGFAFNTFDASPYTQSSLWFGAGHGLYASSGFFSGVRLGLGYRHAPRYSRSFASWVGNRRRDNGLHRGWRGRNYDYYDRDRHDHGYGYGSWDAGCWDPLWDPWYGWSTCPYGWGAGQWWPYPSNSWGYRPYPNYSYSPVYHTAYRPIGLNGWSFGINLSFGSRWGDPYGWGPYDRWGYGRNRHSYYGPWAGWNTVYVDPGPRWVVRSPTRIVRAGPSARIAGGGWVSQSQFKEDPRSPGTQVRTAVARPSRQSASTAQSGLDRSATQRGTARSAPRSEVGQARPARGAATVRRESDGPARTGARSARARPDTPPTASATARAASPDRPTRARPARPANEARRPTVIRGSGSRAQPSATQGRVTGSRRPTPPAARPGRSAPRSGAERPSAQSRSADQSRSSARERRAPNAGQRPSAQVRAPRRAGPADATPSRPSGSRSSSARVRPSRSSPTRSSPQRANPSRSPSARSGGSRGSANRGSPARSQGRVSAPSSGRSRPAATPSRSGGGGRSSPARAPRGATRR